MPSLPTSALPLLKGLLIMGLESHYFSQRTLHRACSPRTCILLWDQKGKPHDFPCLSGNCSFKRFLSISFTSFIPDPSNPTLFSCSNFSRWSSERKNMLWCSIPLSYILHVPTLEVFFFHILLSSKYTCIDIFLLKWWPSQRQFFIHSSLKYKLVTPKTNSAGSTVLHFQMNAEAFNIIVFFTFCCFFLKKDDLRISNTAF